MNKLEKDLFEQIFLTCPNCTGPANITSDFMDEEGNLVLVTTCEICETVFDHTVTTTEA